ncbi:hypothetical protein GCK72_020791 [Caenorhabditis remanei]|uniref:Uncharacterized protein n=1 Tax=Caenorhabditis remanei TaxID=31234 RepID=A0A6A5GI06_CAERE|nr:hypothetical protein GCK72_020791 [Caenorhabditis remanei]KAF1754231.1 hypothetical protein GCK72_020791 [Caenorhabditis remanei]
MPYPSFIVDAFTTTRFAGNPAAVCLIPEALDEKEYQKIAAEFNLSETAFPVPTTSKDYKLSSTFSLRWFTPTTEVPLCGHATLATAHVLFNEIGNSNDEIKFETKSGVLTVKNGAEGLLEMDFPRYDLNSIRFNELINPLADKFSEIDAPPFLFEVIKCLIPNKIVIESVIYAPKYGGVVVIIDPDTTKSEFEAFKIDAAKALVLHDGSFVRGLAISLRPSNPVAQGFIDLKNEPYDYACRYFGPWDGVIEDPATGSAQCVIAPFWEKITGKEELYGFQAFPGRGAQFRLLLKEDRVVLKGSAVSVLRGEIVH